MCQCSTLANNGIVILDTANGVAWSYCSCETGQALNANYQERLAITKAERTAEPEFDHLDAFDCDYTDHMIFA